MFRCLTPVRLNASPAARIWFFVVAVMFVFLAAGCQYTGLLRHADGRPHVGWRAQAAPWSHVTATDFIACREVPSRLALMQVEQAATRNEAATVCTDGAGVAAASCDWSPGVCFVTVCSDESCDEYTWLDTINLCDCFAKCGQTPAPCASEHQNTLTLAIDVNHAIGRIREPDIKQFAVRAGRLVETDISELTAKPDHDETIVCNSSLGSPIPFAKCVRDWFTTNPNGCLVVFQDHGLGKWCASDNCNP